MYYKMHLFGQLTAFVFIGLFHISPSYGQHETDFPHNYDLPKMLKTISSLISASQDLKNMKAHPEGNLILDQFRSPISNQFLKNLMANSDDSNRCFQDMKYAFNNPLDKDQLGLKMLDAFGKPENGILDGNIKWVGNYFECTNIQAPPNENSTAGDFRGQYCTLDMSLNAFNKTIPLSLGVCLPDSCGSVPLEKFKEKFNASLLASFVNITMKTCQPVTKKVTSAAIAMICLLSFFVILALVGSSITAYEYITKMSPQETQEQINIGNLAGPTQDNSSSADLVSNQRENGWFGTVKEFFSCFCVFSNGEKILNTGSTEGQLLCLHGIRFLSMTWVIVCHVYGFVLVNTRNTWEGITTINTWLFQIILHGYYSVDSFFLLSGFLVAYLFFQESAKRKGKVSWLYFYVHRYVRLTPVYMLVLGFFTALQYYMGSGPFWQVHEIAPVCRQNWWYNILYINNFVPHEKLCMGWTWYLANDMQFFVISPILLITLWRWPKIGYSVLGLFMSVTVAANLGIIYHFDLQTGYGNVDSNTSVLDINLQASMEDENSFNEKIYEKPYTRMSPYLVGILLAYFLFKRKQNNAGKVNLITLVCGWIVAAATMLACLFSLYHRRLSVPESAFYNALGHAAFTGGLSWVIFTCINKQAGPVDSILSFKLFIPLSRLTYCAYLIHPIVLTIYFGSLKTTLQFSHLTMVTLFLGQLVITYFFSFVLSVLFESPIIRLEKVIRTKLMS